MKKILSILALCTVPLIVTSCATNPVDPTDNASDTTATKQTIDSTCRVLIPGTIIEIRQIHQEDECTCLEVREGDVYEHSHDDDDDDDDDDDSYRNHNHNHGRKHGHYKHEHKHKHKHKKKHHHHGHDDDDDDDDDHGHHHHYSDHSHTSRDIRSWVVTIIGSCGDTSRVVFTRNGNMVEVRADSNFCKRDFRPADSTITYDSAQTSVTTEKKGAEVQEWEVEKNPTTQKWKYFFIVKHEDKKYLVGVDAQTGQITEDKEI